MRKVKLVDAPITDETVIRLEGKWNLGAPYEVEDYTVAQLKAKYGQLGLRELLRAASNLSWYFGSAWVMLDGSKWFVLEEELVDVSSILRADTALPLRRR